MFQIWVSTVFQILVHPGIEFGASGGSKIMTARSPNVQSAVQKTGADLVPSFGTERVVGVVGIEGGVVGGGGWDVKVQRNHT